MKTLTHSLVQEWIMSGRILDPEEAAGLSEHLAGCPECRQFAAFQKELLTSVPRIAPVATHSERELRQKTAAVQARLKERSTATRFFHGTRAVALVFSAVAMVALLAFVIVRLIPEQSRLTPGGPDRGTASAASETPLSTPSPTASASLPEAVQSFLKTFPLVPGTQWMYADTEYDPDPSDATKTIQAVFEITETVVEVKISGSDYLAHLQRKVSAVSSDPAWSGQSHSPAADSEWWYIVHAGQVFNSPTLPADLQAIDFGSLTLEFKLPLTEGGRWCPSHLGKGNLDPAAPTVEPCPNDIGARLVLSADPFKSTAGTFPTCYLLEDVYNTGNILQTFCEGVGVVAHKFDHAGTRFGFNWSLTGFRPGASGGETSTATASPTPATTGQSLNEQVLAKALLNTAQKAYCSWMVLGYGEKQVIYAWALCQQQDFGDTAVSAPVVIHLRSDGHFDEVVLPRDGALYGPDVRQLFPAGIADMILGQNLSLQGLEWGIAQRKAGVFKVPYVTLASPMDIPGCSWKDEPLANLPASTTPGLDGWKSVVQAKTGFSLSIPADWSAIQSGWDCGAGLADPYFLALQPPDMHYQLNVGFRRPDQAAYITRTGTPAGDFFDAAPAHFFGKDIQVQRLIYQGRDMAVFYSGSSEFAAGGDLFTLSLDITSGPKNDQSLPLEVENQARRILESFQTYPPASPSPTPTPVQTQAAAQPLMLVSQRGGAVSGLALQGSTAYVGIGPRLAALDVSDAAAPRMLVQSPALPGLVSGVLLFPATPKLPAAAVSAGRYVEILGLGEADKITLLDEVILPGTINVMVLDKVNWKLYVGGFIYQAYDPNSGRVNSGFVAVIDLNTKVQLIQVRELADPVGSLALTKNMIYAGHTNVGPVSISGIPLISPSELGEPQPAVTASDPALEVYSLQAAGDRLYVGSYSAILAYDISNPAAPIEKWRATQDDAGNTLMMVQGFVLHPDRIDMAGLMPSGGYGGPWQASLTPPEAVPANPDQETTSKAASSGARLYVARGELDIFDAADSKALKPLGAYHPPLYATIQQITRGDLVYTLDTDPVVQNWPQALHVLRLPDLQTVSEYAFQNADDAPTWEYFGNMALEGDRLYLFDMHKGTWVFDLTDPLKPALLNRPGALNEPMRSATAVKVGDRRLVFISVQAESGNSLAVYDVTDLSNIQQLSSLDLKNESAKRLAWSGSALFAVTEGVPDGGTNPLYWFYAISLENDTLKVQSRMQLAEDSNLAVQGNLAALASPQKLVILSAANLAQMHKFSETELPGSAINLAFKGDQLFMTVSGSSTQLMVFDLSDPSLPRLVSATEIPFTDFFTIADPYLVVAGISSGIEVLK